MVIGAHTVFSCATNFLNGRKCVFCGSFKTVKTARSYVKCMLCGKQKSLSKLRPQVRVWMETWFYLKRQEQYRIDQFDMKLLKERRNLQGLLDALYKHRKSVHDYGEWQSHWHASAALQEKN